MLRLNLPAGKVGSVVRQVDSKLPDGPFDRLRSPRMGAPEQLVQTAQLQS
jgi:hypothetical protein